MTHLDEPLGQHMLHPATQELLPAQRQHPLLAPVRVVLPGERHRLVRHRHQPAVAQRRPVHVTRQVLQHHLRPRRRRLAVHHPILPYKGRSQAAHADASASDASRPPSDNWPLRMGLTQQRQELPPEHAAEHPHRQEEPRTARPPTRRLVHTPRAVARQPTPRSPDNADADGDAGSAPRCATPPPPPPAPPGTSGPPPPPAAWRWPPGTAARRPAPGWPGPPRPLPPAG